MKDENNLWILAAVVLVLTLVLVLSPHTSKAQMMAPAAKVACSPESIQIDIARWRFASARFEEVKKKGWKESRWLHRQSAFWHAFRNEMLASRYKDRIAQCRIIELLESGGMSRGARHGG